MAFKEACEYLSQFGFEARVTVFEQSSATVELAANALGCEPEKIAKTMSFLLENTPILIVTAGDVKIDNKKYKNYFKQKAKLIPYDLVENYIGHQPGGVCPFGIKEKVPVYLDFSLKRFKKIYPACGSENSAVALTPEELASCLKDSKWIDVCTDGKTF